MIKGHYDTSKLFKFNFNSLSNNFYIQIAIDKHHITCKICNMTNTRFQQYISQIGDHAAAKKFFISKRTAQSYRLGERQPRLCQVPRLIKSSEGALCYSCFFESANEA